MITVTQTRFDTAIPIAIPVTSRDTKRHSFRSLEDLGDKQRAVLAAIRAHGPVSDRTIGERLGWSVNRITGRRSELVALGLVRQEGTTLDAETNRRVALWRAA